MVKGQNRGYFLIYFEFWLAHWIVCVLLIGQSDFFGFVFATLSIENHSKPAKVIKDLLWACSVYTDHLGWSVLKLNKIEMRQSDQWFNTVCRR